jgi:hypothetical protein
VAHVLPLRLACEPSSPSVGEHWVELGIVRIMLRKKAVVAAVLCWSVFALSSCGGDPGDEIADVTTTTVAATTAAPGQSTESVPESTTTTQAPAPSGGADNAEAAIRQFIEAKGLGQTGRAWDLLLPAQRALLSRDAYFACEDPTAIDIVGVEAIDQYPERIPVAGIGEQDSVAVTLKITVTAGGREFSETDTYNALSENGRWYVTLTDEAFDCAKA